MNPAAWPLRMIRFCCSAKVRFRVDAAPVGAALRVTFLKPTPPESAAAMFETVVFPAMPEPVTDWPTRSSPPSPFVMVIVALPPTPGTL